MRGARSISSWPRGYVSPSLGLRSNSSRNSTSTSPSTSRRHRRQAACHATEISPSATIPSGIASSPTGTSSSVPAATTVRAELSSPTGPRRTSARRCPGVRSKSATLATNGDRVSGFILVEERLVLPGVFRPGQRRLLGRRQGGHPQLLSTRLHGLRRAFEHDLEGGQLLVAVVLRLVLEAAGDVPGVLDGVAGHELGLPDDLGSLHHALGSRPCRGEDVVGFSLDLAEELLAFP